MLKLSEKCFFEYQRIIKAFETKTKRDPRLHESFKTEMKKFLK